MELLQPASYPSAPSARARILSPEWGTADARPIAGCFARWRAGRRRWRHHRSEPGVAQHLLPAAPRRESFENDRILLDIPAAVSAQPQVLGQIAARHGMTRLQTSFIRLTGRTLHLWRIDNGTPAPQMIFNVCTTEPQTLIARAQPSPDNSSSVDILRRL